MIATSACPNGVFYWIRGWLVWYRESKCTANASEPLWHATLKIRNIYFFKVINYQWIFFDSFTFRYHYILNLLKSSLHCLPFIFYWCSMVIMYKLVRNILVSSQEQLPQVLISLNEHALLNVPQVCIPSLNQHNMYSVLHKTWRLNLGKWNIMFVQFYPFKR